ncbi:hypothetical protein CSUI_010409, partial [Cystoisospora suis]
RKRRTSAGHLSSQHREDPIISPSSSSSSFSSLSPTPPRRKGPVSEDFPHGQHLRPSNTRQIEEEEEARGEGVEAFLLQEKESAQLLGEPSLERGHGDTSGEAEEKKMTQKEKFLSTSLPHPDSKTKKKAIACASSSFPLSQPGGRESHRTLLLPSCSSSTTSTDAVEMSSRLSSRSAMKIHLTGEEEEEEEREEDVKMMNGDAALRGGEKESLKREIEQAQVSPQSSSTFLRRDKHLSFSSSSSSSSHLSSSSFLFFSSSPPPSASTSPSVSLPSITVAMISLPFWPRISSSLSSSSSLPSLYSHESLVRSSREKPHPSSLPPPRALNEEGGESSPSSSSLSSCSLVGCLPVILRRAEEECIAAYSQSTSGRWRACPLQKFSLVELEISHVSPHERKEEEEEEEEERMKTTKLSSSSRNWDTGSVFEEKKKKMNQQIPSSACFSSLSSSLSPRKDLSSSSSLSLSSSRVYVPYVHAAILLLLDGGLMEKTEKLSKEEERERKEETKSRLEASKDLSTKAFVSRYEKGMTERKDHNEDDKEHVGKGEKEEECDDFDQPSPLRVLTMNEIARELKMEKRELRKHMKILLQQRYIIRRKRYKDTSLSSTPPHNPSFLLSSSLLSSQKTHTQTTVNGVDQDQDKPSISLEEAEEEKNKKISIEEKKKKKERIEKFAWEYALPHLLYEEQQEGLYQHHAASLSSSSSSFLSMKGRG